MNRKERRRLSLTGMTHEQIIARLEELGPILWDPDSPEGYRRGWAICPCCGQRTLEVLFELEAQVTP